MQFMQHTGFLEKIVNVLTKILDFQHFQDFPVIQYFRQAQLLQSTLRLQRCQGYLPDQANLPVRWRL